MEELWKKAAILGAVGLILGIFFGALFWYLGTGEAPAASAQPNVMILHLILSGVLGMVANGSSVLYEIETWSIARSTITHFIIAMATFYVVAFTLRWFAPTDPVCWIMSVILVIVYFIIWMIQYLIYKHKVKRMNEELKKWKSMRRDD